jgi:hypothetical protein
MLLKLLLAALTCSVAPTKKNLAPCPFTALNAHTILGEMDLTVSEVYDLMFPLVSLIQPFMDLCSLYQLSLCSEQTRQLCHLLVQQNPVSIISAAASYNSNKPRLLVKSVQWACKIAGVDGCSNAAVAAAVAAVPVPAAVKRVLMKAGVCPTLQHIFNAASRYPQGLEDWVDPQNSNWWSFPALMQAVCQNDEVGNRLQHAMPAHTSLGVEQ